MWIIVALFLVLTIILLSGKGGFLIAGYNTASKEEKAKYNEKKLCRVMGAGMGIITMVLAILAFYKENTPGFFNWLMPVVILGTAILMIILSNTICKEKTPKVVEETEDDRVKIRRINRFVLVFVIVIFGVVGVTLTTGDIKVNVNEDMIKIEGSYWSDQTIAFEDIQSVDFIENISVGSRTNGFGSFKLNEGHFRNNQFGDYILYSYTKCKSYIVIKTDSDILVINGESSSDTEELYKEIKEN